MKKLLLLLIICTIFQWLYGQKQFSAEQLKNDFDIFSTSLQQVHPSVYRFITKDSLQQIFQQSRQQITEPQTELAFHTLLRQTIRHIRCGHTTAKPSADWYNAQIKSPKLIPLEVIFLDDQLYVKQAFEKDTLLRPGTKIKAINDRLSSNIIQEMKAIQEIDGFSTTYENTKIERLFRTYFLFLYGRSDQYKIDFLDPKGITKSTFLEGGIAKPKSSSNLDSEALFQISGSTFSIAPGQANMAILDINNFTSKGYKKYYKKVFKSIRQKGIQHLVIDLRGNGGGYFPNGNTLLKYLLPQEFSMDFSRPKTKIAKNPYLKMPFSSKMTRWLFGLIPDDDKADPHRNYAINYKPKKKYGFNGQIYVLIDGGTFSMGSLVATRLKHSTDCQVIGEETGGGELGSNAVLMYELTLPETQIRIKIPYYFLIHKVDSKIYGRGVIPQIKTNYQLEDILQNRDLEMIQIQQMINQ